MSDADYQRRWQPGVETDARDGGAPSDTTEEQLATEEACQRCIDEICDPELRREAASLLTREHRTYCASGLWRLSAGYASLDASRPWLCYWIVHSLSILGTRIDAAAADAVINFIGRCRDPDCGGFCGGPYPGQMAHLAPTYAAVNTLVTIGTPAAFELIKGAKLGSFLRAMRREDGAFTMHHDGEVDVRGAYCAIAVATLSGEVEATGPWEDTANWILGCQTYEGGVGATPGEEAHGGYTFCGLAALSLLGAAHRLRLPPLVRWLVGRQMAHAGGFQGRTNKLVDSCYSFWQGGAFPLVQSLLQSRGELAPGGAIYNAPALLDYLIVCAQVAQGGLRDKPGKGRDYYHTCYALSGLAVAASASELPGVPEGWVNGVRLINPIFNVVNDKVEAALEHFRAAE